MNADELVRLVSDALFAVVFLGSLALAVRDRRRAAVNAALMFGSLAFVILEGEVTRGLGITLPELAGDLVVVVLLAVPYLFLRLADDLTTVPAVALRIALAGFVLSAAAIAVARAPYPPPLVLLIVVYFGGIEIYGGVLLVRESFRASGVPKRRAQAAALGSLFLGITLLVAGLQQFVPQAAPLIQSLTRLLVLLSALAYAAAVTPPRLLKRAWLEPQLRGFLVRVSSISPDEERARIVGELEARIAQALGASKVVVALGGGPDRLGDQAPEAADALARAFTDQRPLVGAVPSGTGDDRRAVLAAPMTARGRRLGALAVVMDRAPLFSEDDLDVAGLLAGQAALILDGSRLYADLAAVNQQLQDATRAKTEFLANMSHELRTPLNAVLGFSDLLVEQLDRELTPAQRRYFNNIKDAGNHLLQLINEVLDLSKVEAGRLEIRPEPIRLSTLLEPVLAATKESAASAGQTLEHRYAADLVVRVDPGRMRQIMYNLLSNAVKFTPAGGRVALRVDARGRDLLVEVSDTGIGIPDDKKDRVFGTFERLHEGRSEASGTGLGLALTKKLVELHGGTIGFESEEARGSTFRVAIPDAVSSPVTGPRILVVEDDRRDAELLAALAGRLGVATEIVATAASARDAVQRDEPLAILLDLRLPDERGEALLRELKNDPRTRSIPVLVVSVEDDEGRLRPLGADDHLTKPIDRARVSAWIRRHVVARTEVATPAS